MTFILLLSILLISTICQSLKPNLNKSGYFTKELKNTSKIFQSFNTTTAQSPLEEAKNNNYSNFNKTWKNLSKYYALLSTTTSKPLAAKVNQKLLDLDTKFSLNTRPYTAGAVSNILNRFSAMPALENPFGSYQTQIKLNNPKTSNNRSLPAAFPVKGEVFHPGKQPPIQERKRLERQPKSVTLVSATSLNTKIFHSPQNETKGNELSTGTTSRPASQYNHRIVHQYVPKFMSFPFKRKQRNFNENSRVFNGKLTEKERNNDNDEIEYAADNDSDDAENPYVNHKDDDDDDTEDISMDTTSEPHPLNHHEKRYYHDIFLNYPRPHHVNYGHVQYSPELFEKRFESLKEGNRYKGEIIWHDDKGGYAQHHWDMALGKL